MNKKEFIEALAEQSGFSKADAGKSLQTMIDIIVATNKMDEKVSITGFGTFEARRTKATLRKNPRTGESVHVPEKMVPKFRAGKTYKEAILGR